MYTANSRDNRNSRACSRRLRPIRYRNRVRTFLLSRAVLQNLSICHGRGIQRPAMDMVSRYIVLFATRLTLHRELYTPGHYGQVECRQFVDEALNIGKSDPGGHLVGVREVSTSVTGSKASGRVHITVRALRTKKSELPTAAPRSSFSRRMSMPGMWAWALPIMLPESLRPGPRHDAVDLQHGPHTGASGDDSKGVRACSGIEVSELGPRPRIPKQMCCKSWPTFGRYQQALGTASRTAYP